MTDEMRARRNELQNKRKHAKSLIKSNAYWADHRWAKVSHYRKYLPSKANELILEIRADHGVTSDNLCI